MFQGSANVKKSEHMQLVERAGGDDERLDQRTTAPTTSRRCRRTASTSGCGSRRTGCARWRSRQTNFENQRQTVKEERRLGVDNQPYAEGASRTRLTLPFDSTACFAYAHTVIGDMADLDSAQRRGRAGLLPPVLRARTTRCSRWSGDFDAAEARRLIAAVLRRHPARGRPRRRRPARCGSATGARRFEMTDNNANLPLVAVVYKAPAVSDADAPALELLTSILADGESGRLNLRLVRGERAAMQSRRLRRPAAPRRHRDLLRHRQPGRRRRRGWSSCWARRSTASATTRSRRPS